MGLGGVFAEIVDLSAGVVGRLVRWVEMGFGSRAGLLCWGVFIAGIV